VGAGPGVEHAIVGYAAQGQQYRITGASAWLRIDFSSLVGWESARWVATPEEHGDAARESVVRCGRGDRPG